jgi:hypothetical protein
MYEKMNSFPPYPADYDGQVEWHSLFEQTMNTYIDRVQAVYDSYIKYPLTGNLFKVYGILTELVEECDQFVAAAVLHVRISENRSTPEIISWLRNMALRTYPRTRAMKDLYTSIEQLYRAALPPMPDVDLTPAKGREGFYIT